MRSCLSVFAAALVALVWSHSALAVPIPVVLTSTTGSASGFSYSILHSATSSCITISSVEFCQNGAQSTIPAGSTLTGFLDGDHLYGLSGTLVVSGGADIIVTDGDINFAASAADTFGGYLTTSTHETFYFLDHAFAGPANSLTATSLFLWGNNWDTGTAADHLDPDWGVDLGFDIEVVPEPTTALLLGAGLMGLAAIRRSRSGV